MNNDEIITHLDEILADLADEQAEYRATTVGYVNSKWKPPPPKGTHWSNGDLAHDAATIKLESLKDALKPPPPPPPPPPPVTAGVFVSPTGNDGNDGSILAPFRTLTRARNVMHLGGPQTCYLRGGLYPVAASETLVNYKGVTVSYGLRLTQQDSGQTYQAFNNEPVILDGGSTSATTGLHVLLCADGASHVTFDGLDVQHFRWVGIGVHGRVFFYDVFPQTVPEARGVTIRNCKIHDGAYDTSPIYGYGAGPIFGVRSCPELTVDHCAVWNVPTGGISIAAGPPNGAPAGESHYLDGLKITSNAVTSTCQKISDAGGIYVQDQFADSKMVIASNFVRDVAGGRWIYLDDGTSNADVTGNVMAGLGDIACTVHGGKNVKWRGNLIDAAAHSTNGPVGAYFQGSSIVTDHQGVEWAKNIFITKATLRHWIGVGFPTVIKNNLYFAYPPATKASITTGSDTNPVYADPKLSGLYELAADSPAYAAPVSFPALKRDWGPPGYVIPAGTSPSYV